VGYECGGVEVNGQYMKLLWRLALVNLLTAGLGDGAFAQSLDGIFEQGAEELKEYGQQLGALSVFAGLQEQGYQIQETGLASIGGITGDEYGLHQAYFGSLAAVNPAVAGMPEVGDILAVEGSMARGMAAGFQRWKASGWLTAADLLYIDQVYSQVCSVGSEGLQELQVVLTADSLTMTDDERMRQIVALDQEMKEWDAAVERFEVGVEVLVRGRKEEEGGG